MQKEKMPSRIRNLAELKRLIKPGAELKAVYHKNHPDIVGLTRVITDVQTNAFYSKVKDQPEHRYSQCNYGKGLRTDIEKAGRYIFDGDTVRVLDNPAKDGSVLYGMEFYDREQCMTETEDTEMTSDEGEAPVMSM